MKISIKYPFIFALIISNSAVFAEWQFKADNAGYSMKMLLAATIVFMPIVLAYTIWVYRIMRGKVTVEQVQANQHTMY
ncbi:MAG: hypothetical protein WCL34_01735 [Methylococcaceae bacterium]